MQSWNLREIDAPGGSRSPVVLRSDAAARAVLIALEQGQELGDHQVKEHALVAIHVYRLLQEALNNVARHSQSTHANVRLCCSPEAVVLEVEDDGIGFKQTTAVRGMGLVSMRERAEMMKGRIEFLGASGGGIAAVRARWPVERPGKGGRGAACRGRGADRLRSRSSTARCCTSRCSGRCSDGRSR